MNKLYCGIDLHANNHVICVIDDKDQRLLETKCDNQIEFTLKALSRFKRRLKGVAVESTFNWYWLVDGLMEAGYEVQLVNPAAVKGFAISQLQRNKTDKVDSRVIALFGQQTQPRA